MAFAGPTADFTPQPSIDRNSIEYFRHDMWRTVTPNNPAIVPIANAIRAITHNPLHQLAMVNDVTTLLVEYDSDKRVYGVDDFHATLNEMIARQRAGGWAYLRDDCDGRAVFAAHLLAALGIPWRLDASYWKEHAWVVARVNGINYDLLDLRANAPEYKTRGYRLIGHWFVRASHPPPAFNWREAWVVRTHENLKIGLTLGMLTLDSNRYAMHVRHARDWTVLVPNGNIPPPDDPRTVLAGVAGFPYGAPLHTGMLAGEPKPARAGSTGAVLGSVTGANSNPADPAPATR
ncbi:MAG TPA: hypothetical protein VHE61_20875 [Opitutaceae bacterium]|nr:hypothetical protein [Opitutaceae bacterium]